MLNEKKPRLESVDFLRGLVMLVMAIDHSRDFFSIAQAFFSPTDIANTTPWYYMTRWITNICAPVFIFLAGMGVSFSSKQEPAKRSVFLLTRGVWLLFLEVAIMNLLWFFNGDRTEFIRLGVLWSIGWSMIILAGVSLLPRWFLWIFALGLIFGHNLLDGISAEAGGLLWTFLHVGGVLHPVSSMTLHVLYPIIPWCGIIVLGFLLGGWTKTRPETVRRDYILVGSGIFLAAVLLRLGNFYGNPTPWTVWPEFWRTVADFTNGLKYPPSLLYIGLNFAPLLILLGVILRRPVGPLGRIITTFGQVPFFFYILHVFLLHLMAVLWFQLRFGVSTWLLQDPPSTGIGSWPTTDLPASVYLPDWDLPQVYVAWLLAILILYPLCRWFAQLKSRRKDWWLSYL